MIEHHIIIAIMFNILHNQVLFCYFIYLFIRNFICHPNFCCIFFKITRSIIDAKFRKLKYPDIVLLLLLPVIFV